MPVAARRSRDARPRSRRRPLRRVASVDLARRTGRPNSTLARGVGRCRGRWRGRSPTARTRSAPAGTAASTSPRRRARPCARRARASSSPRRPGVVTLRCGPLARHPSAAGARSRSRSARRVRAGRVVGTVGASGEHRGLHLGVRREGDRFAYVDPLPFLAGRTTAAAHRPAAAHDPHPALRSERRPPERPAAAVRPHRRAVAPRRALAPRVGRAAPALAAAPRRRRRALAAPRRPSRRRPRGSSLSPAGAAASRLGPPGSGSRCCCSARSAAACVCGCGGVARGASAPVPSRAMIAALLIGFGLGASVAAQLGPLSLLAIRSTLRNGVRGRAGDRRRHRGHRHAVRRGRRRRGGGAAHVRARAAGGGRRRRGRARLPRGEDAVQRVPDPARRRDRRGAGHAEARVRRRARRDRLQPADDRVVGGGVRGGLDGRRDRGLRGPDAARRASASAASRGWRSSPAASRSRAAGSATECCASSTAWRASACSASAACSPTAPCATDPGLVTSREGWPRGGGRAAVALSWIPTPPLASPDADGLLRHHPHLLRERGPAPGARVHHHRRRHPGPAHAPARGGGVLPHGHGRARRAGRAGRRARGRDAEGARRPQRRALQGAAAAHQRHQRLLHPHVATRATSARSRT